MSGKGQDTNLINWPLSDNAADTTVWGNEVSGALVGGNTADVAATVNGKAAFHLNGSSQYVEVTIPNIWPQARRNLWTKHPDNPVLSDTPTDVRFGVIVPNPGGGWYFFGPWGTNTICRWSSTDLVTWGDKITALATAPGAWDETMSGVTCFQRASDDLWIMLYRGGTSSLDFAIGKATSADGATFTRIDNGGVDDGKFPQFGSNYDPIGCILVGTRYYMYVNGDPNHGVENVYYSDDDFETFTANPNNPILPKGLTASNNQTFCPCVWKHGNYYYMMISRSMAVDDATLYNYGMMLYRSSSPLFDVADTDFIGYAVVNDQSYDQWYLDVPSTPHTDIYKDTYASEFGDTLYAMYGGNSGHTPVQNLCWTNINSLTSLTPVLDRVFAWKVSFSFWVQFDSLTHTDPVFSVGSAPNEGSPPWAGTIRLSGGKFYFGLYLGNTYKLCTTELAINTPYHIVIVENTVNRTVYINNVQAGQFTEEVNHADDVYLYMGKNGSRFLDGYMWDFRIYPDDLSAAEVSRLYLTGYAY
jgi:hypothetical protein